MLLSQHFSWKLLSQKKDNNSEAGRAHPYLRSLVGPWEHQEKGIGCKEGLCSGFGYSRVPAVQGFGINVSNYSHALCKLVGFESACLNLPHKDFTTSLLGAL